MNKERVLVLGTGQAGGNIADIFAQNGYDTLVFNTANSDLDKLKNVKNKVIVGDTEGSGKNPNLSKENFQTYGLRWFDLLITEPNILKQMFRQYLIFKNRGLRNIRRIDIIFS